MNTELFQHEDFGDIRMKQVDGKPWFVAKDLCHALDMSNVHDATKELNPSEKGFDSIDIAGSVGREAVLIVSESGLYQMIFESRSRKPETKKFIRWITSLVLPAIRRYRLGHLKQLEAEDRQNREAIGRIKAELEVIDNRLAAAKELRTSAVTLNRRLCE